MKDDALFSKCGWSPYEDREVIFPYTTLVGGKLMMKDGAVLGRKGGDLWYGFVRMGSFVGFWEETTTTTTTTIEHG